MNDSNKNDPKKMGIPEWGKADLPEAKPLGWQNLRGFIGPGIVMCGIQLAGGEWLLGSEITARFGGGLMWIAGIAIVLQVFYNMECGRYALYCGEPVFTGFMRAKPGPKFWICIILLLNFGAFIPGLSTHGAAVLASMYLGHPAGETDRTLVIILSYLLLAIVSLPILVGGKIYNTIEKIMTLKVIVVLGFSLFVGIFFVSATNWGNVFGGFLKFGTIPVVMAEDKNGNGRLDPGEDFDRDGRLDNIEKIIEKDAYGNITKFEDIDGDGRWDGENVTNIFSYRSENGTWPVILLTQIALIGAFAGFAGGGGLGNSTYSNYVRDKGWGMGSQVGAIPSAIGGRKISLSHVGKTFPLSDENLRRWKGWWRYILSDQLLIWMPGCIMGMALPALISIQFSPHSEMFHQTERLDWAQAIISADGLRNAPSFSPELAQIMWISTLLVGLMVLLPSQMSIVEDVCRRWTDIIWSGSRRVRERMKTHDVKRIYYTILAFYMTWTFVCATIFLFYSKPKIMILVIANLNNLALGTVALLLLRTNVRLLPKPLRPGWISRLGLISCSGFYLGLAALVFYQKQIPLIYEILNIE
ncbi:MAG: Nramp family divalent metal transporter [Verrucomicrobiota bacterium]|nr:Nramp family divalent metal transporter [Verrucomicrobiota bacterium]